MLRAFEGLARAIETRDPVMIAVYGWPGFAALLADARFDTAMRAMRLPAASS